MHGKASLLVMSINIEHILEGIHLWRNIFTFHNECTILELV